jgi:sulfoxide reductase catalytic subunit YedY
MARGPATPGGWTRREVVRGASVAAGAWAVGCVPAETPLSPEVYTLPEVRRNPNYTLDRAVTQAQHAARDTRYIELGDTPDEVAAAAASVRVAEWTVEVGGLVSQPRTYTIQELITSMPIEERTYRFRALNGHARAVPWIGFPLRALLDAVVPSDDAKYVTFEADADPASRPNIARHPASRWPYADGLRLDEARHDLTMLALGAWGRDLTTAHGAPIRLVVPWKYGYKSVKAIRRVSLVAEEPRSFTAAEHPKYADFLGNVDPSGRGPQGSQATEQVIPSRERVPTLPFNGYGDLVAALYR